MYDGRYTLIGPDRKAQVEAKAKQQGRDYGKAHVRLPYQQKRGKRRRFLYWRILIPCFLGYLVTGVFWIVSGYAHLTWRWALSQALGMIITLLFALVGLWVAFRIKDRVSRKKEAA